MANVIVTKQENISPSFNRGSLVQNFKCSLVVVCDHNNSDSPKFKGTVLFGDNSESLKLGDYCDNFNKSNFKSFQGQINITEK